MSVDDDDDAEGVSLADLTQGLLATDKGDGGSDAPVKAQSDDSGDDEDTWQSDDDQAEPTDETDEGGSEDEGEGEGEEETDPTEPLYTVKLGDGKSEQVTLKEALAGYQRNRDYTIKTQEIAEHRKTVDAELAAYRAGREQYATILTTLKERLGDGSDDPTQEELNKLRAEDPSAYAVTVADMQRKREARERVTAEQNRIAAEKTEEGKKTFHEYLGKERNALLEKLPTWKDAEKYKAGAKQVFDFAKDKYGFTSEELDRAYDHRIIVMAEDARRYHAMLAKQAKAKAKLDTAPEVAPRARTPQPTKRQAERAAAEKRFNKTGRVDDALALIVS